jgi:hypothetical protein
LHLFPSSMPMSHRFGLFMELVRYNSAITNSQMQCQTSFLHNT